MLILISVVVLLITLLLYLTKRRQVCTGRRARRVRDSIDQILLKPELVKYEVQDLASPKVVGYPLKVLVTLGFSLLGRSVIFPFIILRRSNLDLLNGEYIPDLPTLYPQVPLPVEGGNRKEVNDNVLKSISLGYSGRADHRCTSLDYYNAYQSGQCTPLDVVRAVLNAISLSNQRMPPLRAVIETDDEYTLKLAKASTERWRVGKPLSLLDGVPFTVKAEVVFESFSLTGGGTFKPTCARGVKEMTVVRKLINEAGAIMVGLNNMQEFGTGVIGSNPHKNYLTPCNPYNDQCYCGGSSSGSASAVAAGLCPISLGGDAGGSIRIPSSLCGVVGLKPTFRLLDSTGFLPQTYSVGVAGPLSSSVLDTAIAMSIMCPEGIDLNGFDCEDLKGVKIGVYKEFFEHADREVVTLCRKAIDVLVSLGAEVKDIVIPELEEVRVAHTITTISEFFNCYAVDVDAKFEEINLETLILFLIGDCFSAKEYINAQKQRSRSIAALQSIFNEVDIIATPSTGTVAPIIPPGADQYGYGNAELSGRLMRFSSLANLTGIPGVSVPVGLTPNGSLPVGLQLQAHWNREGELLRVAYVLEKQLSTLMTKPPVYYDILEEAFKLSSS